MSLSCVQCGAPFADDDATCSKCGLPRAASYPPGYTPPEPEVVLDPVEAPAPEPDVDPVEAPAAEEQHAPEPEPDLEPSWSDPEPPAPEPDLAPFWAEPEPQDVELVEAPAPDEQSWAPPEPEDIELVEAPAPDEQSWAPPEQPVTESPRWTAPGQPFPLPEDHVAEVAGTDATGEIIEPSYAPPQSAWGDQDAYHYGEPEADDVEPSTGIGAFDVFIALLGGAAAFAITFLLNDGDLKRVQDWIHYRGCAGGQSCGDVNVHDLLVAAVSFSPFAIAAATSLWSRVPAIGLVVALVGRVPLLLLGNFHPDKDWPMVLAVGVFVLTDLILLLRRRGLLTGLVVGVLAALGTVAYAAVTFQQQDRLDYVLHRGVLDVQFFVVPGALVLLGGLVGGVFAALRRS